MDIQTAAEPLHVSPGYGLQPPNLKSAFSIHRNQSHQERSPESAK